MKIIEALEKLSNCSWCNRPENNTNDKYDEYKDCDNLFQCEKCGSFWIGVDYPLLGE